MREKLMLPLLEALGSSLNLRLALERSYPLLLRSVPADYAALGLISTQQGSEQARWISAGIPDAFFSVYEQMASHDFIRPTVLKTPNRVLTDEQMLSRTELKRNLMYCRAREVGVPIERVMSVMLQVNGSWQSGLTLCRERNRSFSEGEREALAALVPFLANTVRNCQLFAQADEWEPALTALLEDETAAIILVDPQAREVSRSERAAGLIEKWFAPQRTSSLPDALHQFARTNLASASPSSKTLSRHGSDAKLNVRFVGLPGLLGKASGLLVLRELPRATRLPLPWRTRLSEREQAVGASVLRGWDNRTIARELGCAVGTVKKHLQNIFDKLGVDSRTALIARALDDERPPFS